MHATTTLDSRQDSRWSRLTAFAAKTFREFPKSLLRIRRPAGNKGVDGHSARRTVLASGFQLRRREQRVHRADGHAARGRRPGIRPGGRGGAGGDVPDEVGRRPDINSSWPRMRWWPSKWPSKLARGPLFGPVNRSLAQ